MNHMHTNNSECMLSKSLSFSVPQFLSFTHSDILSHCVSSSSPSQPTFPLYNCSQNPSLWRRVLLEKESSKLGSYHVTMAAGNKFSDFILGKRSAETIILRRYWAHMMGLYRSLLANPWWSWHTTFHKHVQECTAVVRVQFFWAVLCSLLCLSCRAGCFQTQWIHLSGQAQCKKKVLQSTLSLSQGWKRMNRRGRGRMTTVWSQRMLTLAKFDSQMNQPLIKMSVRGKCSCSQHRLLMWSQLHGVYPRWTTCGYATHANVNTSKVGFISNETHPCSIHYTAPIALLGLLQQVAYGGWC